MLLHLPRSDWASWCVHNLAQCGTRAAARRPVRGQSSGAVHEDVLERF
jgi:hypothetical protein